MGMAMTENLCKSLFVATFGCCWVIARVGAPHVKFLDSFATWPKAGPAREGAWQTAGGSLSPFWVFLGLQLRWLRRQPRGDSIGSSCAGIAEAPETSLKSWCPSVKASGGNWLWALSSRASLFAPPAHRCNQHLYFLLSAWNTCKHFCFLFGFWEIQMEYGWVLVAETNANEMRNWNQLLQNSGY